MLRARAVDLMHSCRPITHQMVRSSQRDLLTLDTAHCLCCLWGSGAAQVSPESKRNHCRAEPGQAASCTLRFKVLLELLQGSKEVGF